jgi:hypothetical protein
LKRIAAILLLGTLMFNWFGYQLLTDYMQYAANKNLEARLDNDNYDEEQLIELKVPISLPYQSNWKDYERYNGEIEINGVHYKYVKRKVYNDTLILLCLPNKDKMNIENARENFFKLVNDLQTSHPKKGSEKQHSLAFKNILSEYYFSDNEWKASIHTICDAKFRLENISASSLFEKEVSDQPPDTI